MPTLIKQSANAEQTIKNIKNSLLTCECGWQMPVLTLTQPLFHCSFAATVPVDLVEFHHGVALEIL